MGARGSPLRSVTGAVQGLKVSVGATTFFIWRFDTHIYGGGVVAVCCTVLVLYSIQYGGRLSQALRLAFSQ